MAGVLAHLKDGTEVDRTIYVIDLFPNKTKIPTNMSEVAARLKNLQFANKSREDIKPLLSPQRFSPNSSWIEGPSSRFAGLDSHEPLWFRG